MIFREQYAECSAQETVDAIIYLLKQNGVEIDEKSFTWTLVGALFDKGVISNEEFKRIYFSLISHNNDKEKSLESSV